MVYKEAYSLPQFVGMSLIFPKMPEIGDLLPEPARVGKSDKRTFDGRVGLTALHLYLARVSLGMAKRR